MRASRKLEGWLGRGKQRQQVVYLLHDGLEHEAVALIIHAFLQGNIDTVVPTIPDSHILHRACSAFAFVSVCKSCIAIKVNLLTIAWLHVDQHRCIFAQGAAVGG